MGIENPKIGFGQTKAKRLLEEIALYVSHTDAPEVLYAYNEGMSVLERYIQFTIDSGVSVSELEKSYQNLLNKNKPDVQKAGYEVVDTATMYGAIEKDASSYFLRSRHSIRSYKMRSVEKDIMESVLAIAAASPSACNRQPVKVFWTNSASSVARISKVIPGNKGFENAIPNWCIFQIPISWGGIPEIKKIAGIPEYFAIACAVGFGYPKDQVKCLCAARKPVSEYCVQF